MPPQVTINFWAVLTSAIIAMVVGSVWYSPILFGKKWVALIEKETHRTINELKKGTGVAYTITFIGGLIMAYILAHFLSYANAKTVQDGIQGGFWAWLGFVATTSIGGVLFTKKPFQLFLIDNAYWLLNLLIMGAILAIWK